MELSLIHILGYAAWRVAAIAACGILYAVLYVKGLSLSHRAAYNTLKNLRISLQGKLERQPLGVIQEKGVGALKKTVSYTHLDVYKRQELLRDTGLRVAEIAEQVGYENQKMCIRDSLYSTRGSAALQAFETIFVSSLQKFVQSL